VFTLKIVSVLVGTNLLGVGIYSLGGPRR